MILFHFLAVWAAAVIFFGGIWALHTRDKFIVLDVFLLQGLPAQVDAKKAKM